ncbi:MAG: tRNA (mnm(5)s(2)U34)-methyltransferase [Erysipelotrichaceae bacterium]|nr:class I SAM-dependent methyltransferase [Bacillota bacterium]MDY3092170.1 class I SAM-dependent methyltransferase [Erysipelotrichaceae bacterium]
MRPTTYNQKYLKYLLKDDMVAVDMTMGNGNDTFFLASKVKEVFAFDIQKEAIEHTMQRCALFNNIHYILDDHANIRKYVNNADIVLFNLGYLPYSDKPIITKSDSTIKAIKEAYDILKTGGYMSIIIYRGHKGGLYEYHAVMQTISKYNIIESYKAHTSLTEPVVYIIKK